LQCTLLGHYWKDSVAQQQRNSTAGLLVIYVFFSAGEEWNKRRRLSQIVGQIVEPIMRHAHDLIVADISMSNRTSRATQKLTRQQVTNTEPKGNSKIICSVEGL
jgi:hypothetical protein